MDCENAATNKILGYTLCDACARAYLNPEPNPLIAELTDVVERLVHMAEEGSVPGPNTLAQARAAIAKAKGETP